MAAPPSPTRQQLDELDALMQRMLALPVEEPAEPANVQRESAPVLVEEVAPASLHALATVAPVLVKVNRMVPTEQDRVPPTESPRQPEPEETAADAEPPAAWLLPLVWANGFFDLLTYLLGSHGRWLRGPRGRAALAWLGLLLLLAAAAWAVLDWDGWNW